MLYTTKLAKILFKQINQRCNFSISSALQVERPYKEVRIPGSFGEIAGKWWGPTNTRPILGLHGWQDNCGTFDRLAPYLPENVGFLAIDMPGHGLSSHLSPGMFYHAVDIPILIQKIIDHFNWPKVSLLAHSLGAINSFIYTMLFPKNVDYLISLDGVPFIFKQFAHPDTLAKTINKFLKYDALNFNNLKPHSYSLRELEQLLHKGSKHSVSLEATKYILRRNVAPLNSKKYYFSRDFRLKVGSLLHWSPEILYEGCKQITCPVFIALAKESFVMHIQETAELTRILREANPNVEYHEIEGTHHSHLNTPEHVGNLVKAFIEKVHSNDQVETNFEDKVKIIEKSCSGFA